MHIPVLLPSIDSQVQYGLNLCNDYLVILETSYTITIDYLVVLLPSCFVDCFVEWLFY